MQRRLAHGPLIGAHRGASGYAPENTLAAFDLALAQGAEVLEFDVHQTADGALVVHHDFTLARTGGVDAEIAHLSLAALQEIEIGARCGEAWRGQRIPTLDQVLDRYGDKALLNLEVKVDLQPYPGIEAEIASAIRRRKLAESVIISSFDAPTIQRLRDQAPDLATGFLAEEEPLAAIQQARALGAVAVHLESTLISEIRVRQAHALDLAVLAWTVDDPVEMVRLVDLSVDVLLSNYPDRLAAIVHTRR